MALTNRLGTVKWQLEDDSLTLQASLINQKRLEEDTGLGFFEFIQQLDSDKSNPLAKLAELFYYLQVGTSYTEAEIYACFFADLSLYGDKFNDLQNKLINHMLGQKESEIIAEAQKAEEKKVKS